MIWWTAVCWSRSSCHDSLFYGKFQWDWEEPMTTFWMKWNAPFTIWILWNLHWNKYCKWYDSYILNNSVAQFSDSCFYLLRMQCIVTTTVFLSIFVGYSEVMGTLEGLSWRNLIKLHLNWMLITKRFLLCFHFSVAGGSRGGSGGSRFICVLREPGNYFGSTRATCHSWIWWASSRHSEVTLVSFPLSQTIMKCSSDR